MRKASFELNGYFFCLFFLAHIVKYVQNNLIKNENYFDYPCLTLPDRNHSPKGICDIRRARELFKSTTSNLTNGANFTKKVS